MDYCSQFSIYETLNNILFVGLYIERPIYREAAENLANNPRIGEAEDLIRNVQAPVPPAPPLPDELGADGIQANAAANAGERWARGQHAVQAHIVGQAGEAEEANWNPMEWDRPAEELTWERLLGLDGSLVFLEHVFWVVSLNTLFIMVSLSFFQSIKYILCKTIYFFPFIFLLFTCISLFFRYLLSVLIILVISR
jgi:flagellar biosynthesis protein FliQ